MYANVKSPEKLWADIRAAEQARKERLTNRRSRLSRMVGPAGGTRAPGTEYEPENRLFEWVAYTLPKVAFRNPRVRIRSAQKGFPDRIAKALQGSTNRLMREQRISRPMRLNALDYLMDWGPSMVAQQPRAGYVISGRPVWWPQFYSLEPHVYFQDPLALTIDQARFAGHVYLRDHHTLIEEAKNPENGWNLAEVERLTPEAGVEEVYPDRGDVPPRGEVALYEVWCPELHEDLDEDPDDGFSGTLYTLGCYRDTQGEEPFLLRPPRAYYGPREGPYGCASFLQVRDFPYGVSPTTPAEQQLRDLAATSRAMLDAAHKHKIGTTYPAHFAAEVEKFLNAPGQYGMPLPPGAADLIQKIEIAGVTQQQLLHYEMKGQTLDRVLGMADAQRGVVTGDATASENMIAQQASDIRGGDLKEQFLEAKTDDIKKLVWFQFHDDRFATYLEGQVQGMIQPAFRGGKEGGVKFDDLELEIEPYSMEYESAATKQARTARTMEVVNWLIAAIPQAPWLPWRQIVSEITEDSHIQEALEEIDIKAAVEWAAKMAGFEGEQAPEVQVKSGRQSQGRPINATVKGGQGRGPTSSSYGKGPKALPPQKMGGGKLQSASKGRVA